MAIQKEVQQKIRVSTITPCFRMEKYLPKFLEWLPKQTIFNELEVVLDHNEPTENEIKLVKEFQAKYPGRIKHIIVPKVDPIGTSMNRCIKEATGDLVTIWNVDDLRTDNSIELQATLLESKKDIGIVYGNYWVVRKFGTTKGRLVQHKDIPESELTRSMIIGPFYMFRKSLCQTAGFFDEQLFSGADFDLAVRLAFNAKAAMVTGELGYYLDEGRGASTRPDSKIYLEQNVINLRYGAFDKLYPDHFALVGQYDIPHITNFGIACPVAKFVPQYKDLIKKRYDALFFTGVRRKKLEGISTLKKIKYGVVRWYHGSDRQ